MACPVEEISVRGMRQIHFEQLRAYIDCRKEDGWSYGNRKYFEKRHEELSEWVDGIIRTFEVSK